MTNTHTHNIYKIKRSSIEFSPHLCYYNIERFSVLLHPPLARFVNAECSIFVRIIELRLAFVQFRFGKLNVIGLPFFDISKHLPITLIPHIVRRSSFYFASTQRRF